MDGGSPPGPHDLNRCASGDDIAAGPTDVRRAVLGLLLTSGHPMSITDIIAALHHQLGPAASHKRISDVLRHETRIGRVRRVRRGVYQTIADAFPKATAWRCRNWELEHTRRQQRYEWTEPS